MTLIAIQPTKSKQIAITKYGKQRVVEIDLGKVKTQISDVSEGFQNNPGMISNWAKKDMKVLIQDIIPPEAITIIE